MSKNDYKDDIMTYTPKLNPTRAMMIESAQPVTYKNIELAERILNSYDELVFCIGDAGTSNNKGAVMTAGERVELTDYVFQKHGFDPNRYWIIPIENNPKNYEWASEVRMLTPRWNTFFTRNFLNASIFSQGSDIHGYKIKTISEQQSEVDFFELLSKKENISGLVPKDAIDKMDELGVLERVEAIYNRKNILGKRKTIPNAGLFLGGLQPFTGDYKEGTGHCRAAKVILSEREKLIIALGSAQISGELKDPLTAGQRLEEIRYVLQMNNISASRFYLIPITNIDANSIYPDRVVEFCPAFKYIYSGNNYTQNSYSKDHYEVVPLERIEKVPISASLVRKTAMETLAANKSAELGFPSDAAVAKTREALAPFMAKENLDILHEVGFFNIMDFLSGAIK